MIKRIIGAFGLLFFLSGCATGSVSSAPASAPKYQLNLNGLIDGVKFEKTFIGSAAAHHNITINSAIAVNYFTVASCHRSIQFSDVIKPEPWWSWGEDSKSFDWSYDEAPTIEDSGDCILRFCAFSKVVGSPPVACAIGDFKSSKYTLPGENICNGAHGGATGTALCHTQVGLIERFRFAAPVIVAPKIEDPSAPNSPYWIKDQCAGKFLDEAQTLFEYRVPANECVSIFMEKVAPFRRAKLTVIPYDTPRYPGGN